MLCSLGWNFVQIHPYFHFFVLLTVDKFIFTVKAHYYVLRIQRKYSCSRKIPGVKICLSTLWRSMRQKVCRRTMSLFWTIKTDGRVSRVKLRTLRWWSCFSKIQKNFPMQKNAAFFMWRWRERRKKWFSFRRQILRKNPASTKKFQAATKMILKPKAGLAPSAVAV